MSTTQLSDSKLILPPDGRQTRIDFDTRKGSNEWWHSLTSWFRPESKQQHQNFEKFDEILEEKGYSKKSRKSYIFMLRKFFEHFHEKEPAEITMGNIEDYNFEFFVSGRYSRSYQLQFINAVKLYYLNIFNIDLNLKNLRKTGLKRS